MTIGFIGLGKMGGNIALRLIDQGYQLVVSDIAKGAGGPHLAAGATWADSPAEVAQACDIVLLSLPGPGQVEAVVLGGGGILGGAAPGMTVADLSTSSPELSQRLAARLSEAGARFVDAPVSGSIGQGRQGLLTVLAGGEDSDVENVRPVLESFSREVIHLGPVGAGLVGKLANNAMVLATLNLLAEVASIADSAGITPDRLVSALNATSYGRGMILGFLMPHVVLPKKFDPPAFTLEHGRKDIALFTALARSGDVPAPLLGLVETGAVEMVARGYGAVDSAVMYQLQELRLAYTRP